MKKLLLIASLCTAPLVQAEDSPFVSELFVTKCAELNENIAKYDDTYTDFLDTILTGYLSAHSLHSYVNEDFLIYVPNEDGIRNAFIQETILYCLRNPSDTMLDSIAQSIVKIGKRKGEKL